MLPFVKKFDYQAPEIILALLADEPNLCCLDSAKQHDHLGRYSYFGIDPFLIVKSKGNLTEINNHSVLGNPFDILKSQLNLYHCTHQPTLPPFQGGVIGYFAYDLLHHLENIPKPRQNVIAVDDMYCAFYDCIVAIDHLQHEAWIISHGFPENDGDKRFIRAKLRAEWLFNKIKSNLSYTRKMAWQGSPSAKITSNFTQQSYCEAVQKTIDYIYAGDIFQANITQCFSSCLPEDVSPIEFYLTLRTENPAPFSAFLNFNEICIASASPERFVCLQNSIVETRPIKGTRPRGNTNEQDLNFVRELLASEKDRAENIMIVDLMRNDLSRVCLPDSVTVTQLCGLETYATVHHLVSVIEAKLMPVFDAIDLLKATFPGGSITGAPKIRAMEIIYEIEPSARGVYCGSIGYIGFDGNMDTSIAIRTCTIKQNRIFFQAGGGIVADSVPENEYEESLTKVSTFKKILQGEIENHDPAD